jgi:hypothetical protein
MSVSLSYKGKLLLIVGLPHLADTFTAPVDEMFDIMKQATRGDDVYGVRGQGAASNDKKEQCPLTMEPYRRTSRLTRSRHGLPK